MQTDRTTKVLLFMIATGLWTHVLMAAFTPAPSQAQLQGNLAQPVRIVGSELVLPVNVTQQARPIEVRVLPENNRPATPAR